MIFMKLSQRMNFLVNEYCDRTGKWLSDLNDNEKTALMWAAEQMKSECLIIQDVHEATDMFPPNVYVADFISFPLQYLTDDTFTGRITKETAVIGGRYFLYDAPEDVDKKDIQSFIDAYREYIKPVLV